MTAEFEKGKIFGEIQDSIDKPLWWQNVLEGMNPKDKEVVAGLRAFFESKGMPQRWYYAGARDDITPTFIAPYQAEHWLVDPNYNDSYQFHRIENFVEAYKKLGVKGVEAVLWEKTWEDRRQTLTIDGKIKLQFFGGKTQDRKTAPDSIDVIYTNFVSPFPGPDAFIALKKEGLYVVANDRPLIEKLRLRLYAFNETLTDLGFRLVHTVAVENLHFPPAGKMDAQTEGKSVAFQVYEKTRDFTPVEKDLLQLDSSLGEISEEVHNFVFRVDWFSLGEIANESNRREELKLETDFRMAITRYFKKLDNFESKSSFIETAKTKVRDYFETDGDLPKIVTSDFYFGIKKPEKVRQYYTIAREIYREIKQKFESN